MIKYKYNLGLFGFDMGYEAREAIRRNTLKFKIKINAEDNLAVAA